MSDDVASQEYYSETQATFGDRVAAAREALGLDQAQLAERIGVKLRTIQGWEEDRLEPRANRLQMLSGILNVSMRWLLTGTGDGLEAPQEETPAEIGALLAEMRGLRGEAAQLAEKIGRLEKRLRSQMRQM